ncbi:MAG: hypothetical protein ACTSQ0_01370 [Candidatus Heimdallarchaeota archaeon]
MGYDHNRRCMKCNRRNGFLYYCEDCGGSFCNDCIVSEKTECTFCNECAHISVGSKCEKCGKTNHLTAAKRYLRKCPSCSSIRIKDIPKKIAGLSSEYIEAINIIYSGLDIIRSFASSFSEIVNQAKYLRRERFGLYPNIENNLIRIQGQFYEITQRALRLIEKAYQQISADARLLRFNQQVTIDQLPKIDRVLKSIKYNTQGYANLINDFLKEAKTELANVSELVNELEEYITYFDEVSDKFEPEMLELKIAVVPNVKVTLPDNRRKRTGTIFLTNKHLYFLPSFKFIFRFQGKIRAIPISMIREVETKQRKLFNSYLMINIPDRKLMKIHCSRTELDHLNFLFGVLFNENEGYIISDPYFIEELRTNLDYSILREKVESRIKDLKQIPFTQIVSPQQRQQNIWQRGPVVNVNAESSETKQLRIKLRAARETLSQLEKAFEDRNITPEIYFSRLEKTREKIISLEEKLKDCMRVNTGYQQQQPPQRFSDFLRNIR